MSVKQLIVLLSPSIAASQVARCRRTPLGGGGACGCGYARPLLLNHRKTMSSGGSLEGGLREGSLELRSAVAKNCLGHARALCVHAELAHVFFVAIL